jgi:hypothetical protein
MAEKEMRREKRRKVKRRATLRWRLCVKLRSEREEAAAGAPSTTT